MSTPNSPPSTPYHPVLQTQDYRSLRISDEAMFNLSSVVDIDLSLLYETEQQLQDVNQESIETWTLDTEVESDEAMFNLSSAADIDFSWLYEADQQLQEVYQEVEEVCALDDEIDPVPDSAYNDAYWLLEVLFGYNVSMPDIGWLMDGGIGFEWRSTDGRGIATMSIYGNNQVVYVASLGSMRRAKGTCALSNLLSQTDFLTMLVTSFSE